MSPESNLNMDSVTCSRLQGSPQRLLRCTGCLFSAWLLSLGLAAAASEDAWQFRLSPYGWLVNLEGDIGAAPGAPSVPIDIAPEDVLGDIETAAMLIFNARKGRHGMFADVFYADLRSDVELLPAPIGLTLRTEAENYVLTAAYQYAFYQKNGAVADVLLGARHWGVESTLTFGRGTNGLSERQINSSQSWTDPVVGLKGHLPLGASRFYLEGGVGFGGFGVGSDLFYELSGVIGYQWRESIGIVGGYRLLDVDYSNNSFSYDVKQHGLQFGLTWAF
jgi:hypothetical protein